MENLHEILKELHHWNEVNILYIMFGSNSSIMKYFLKIKKQTNKKRLKGKRKKKNRGRKKEEEEQKKLCIYSFDTNLSWGVAFIDFTCTIFNEDSMTVEDSLRRTFLKRLGPDSKWFS